MSEIFAIHPDNPQARLLRRAAGIVEGGGIIVYPTDSGYALGCQIGNKKGLDRIRKIRQLDKDHNMTLVCRDLAQLSKYAVVTNPIFRLLKAFTPGSYTFILNGTRQVSKLMLHPKKKTLGLRVPEHTICLALLDILETPLMSSTLLLPNAKVPLCEPDAIMDLLGTQVDLIINGGHCSHEPTTIVDLTGEFPNISRVGKGDPKPFRV